MGKVDFAVFVGRFQPVHCAHLRVIEDALKNADHLILVIGSHRAPRSLKNPWTFDQRVKMINDALPVELVHRITIVSLRDFTYSDTHWAVGLQNVVAQTISSMATTKDYPSIRLVGHFKDDSSRYLEWFPQWELERVDGMSGINSRDIRVDYFDNTNKTGWELIHDSKLHPETVFAMFEWATTEHYDELVKEAAFLKDYRKRWESAPFPPVFVTTDAIIVKGGHVLLVKRGRNPGKGCLALPGGFVKPNKSIVESALDEVKEETCIVYPRDKLRLSIKAEITFDHPERDMRGRTITHAFYMKLPAEGGLPRVQGGDDANDALWMPLAELPLHEENFYSDHFHIINSFIHGGGVYR